MLKFSISRNYLWWFGLIMAVPSGISSKLCCRKAIGASPRYIPPGRPQANNLLEIYNRILDTAHAGQRTHLQSGPFLSMTDSE